jgi:hypothetical protein
MLTGRPGHPGVGLPSDPARNVPWLAPSIRHQFTAARHPSCAEAPSACGSLVHSRQARERSHAVKWKATSATRRSIRSLVRG